jgi:hypothetical protein
MGQMVAEQIFSSRGFVLWEISMGINHLLCNHFPFTVCFFKKINGHPLTHIAPGEKTEALKSYTQ